MRIALLTDGIFPYVIGGMQKHSYFLAKELARLGHTVNLFHCTESGFEASKPECFSEEERKFIIPHLVPFPRKPYFPFHYILESYRYSEFIYKELKPLLPLTDFVFAQGFCAWALLKEKHHTRIQEDIPPVAVHFHGFEMFQHIPSFKAAIARYPLQLAVLKNIRKADYSISYGGKITDIIRKADNKIKIWEIPAGVESKWLNQSLTASVKGKTRFVFVGRFERRKGIKELNKAINELLQKYDQSNFSIDFIGEMPANQRISHHAVTYHGKISSEVEIRQILSACDVLICPSYAEGMPNVILEAMACGLAIIATDVGAVNQMVDAHNGWLIENPTPALIARAMLNAMAETNLAEKKKTSIERIRKQFLIEDVTRLLVEKIESACGKKKNTYR